eukprot:2163125-Prymnesium_polylepis.2
MLALPAPLPKDNLLLVFGRMIVDSWDASDSLSLVESSSSDRLDEPYRLFCRTRLRDTRGGGCSSRGGGRSPILAIAAAVGTTMSPATGASGLAASTSVTVSRRSTSGPATWPSTETRVWALFIACRYADVMAREVSAPPPPLVSSTAAALSSNSSRCCKSTSCSATLGPVLCAPVATPMACDVCPPSFMMHSCCCNTSWAKSMKSPRDTGRSSSASDCSC